MKYNFRHAVLLLCIFLGLFFLLQTDTTVDGRDIYGGEVSVEADRIELFPVQVRQAVKAVERDSLPPVVYMPLYGLPDCGEDSFLRALMTGILLISFTIYSLHIIYRADGKKRVRPSLLYGFTK